MNGMKIVLMRRWDVEQGKPDVLHTAVASLSISIYSCEVVLSRIYVHLFSRAPNKGCHTIGLFCRKTSALPVGACPSLPLCPTRADVTSLSVPSMVSDLIQSSAAQRHRLDALMFGGAAAPTHLYAKAAHAFPGALMCVPPRVATR